MSRNGENPFLAAALWETEVPDDLLRGLIGICLTAPSDGVNKSAEYWADSFCSHGAPFPRDGLFQLKTLGLLDVGAGDGFYAILKVKHGRLVGQTALSRPSIPKAVKKLVIARDGGICVYCGCDKGPFHFDHVIPWSRGGVHSAENIVVSCAPCNLTKKDRTPEEMGWLL